MTTQNNPDLNLAFDLVQNTNRHIFLTGKAGTGKTTFLRSLKQAMPKRMIVVAPTGVAAINAGGVTIHSFFQLPFGPFIPVKQQLQGQMAMRQENTLRKFSREKINIIRSLDLLVIDEVSMVRADLLDAIDDVLRRFRDHRLPFGGVQLLMIGDLQQLAPVAKEQEWSMVRSYYDSVYFFSSRALKQTEFVTIELKHIYRQTDQLFIGILNKVRDNQMDAQVLRELNKRYIPNISAGLPEGYIMLTTHNAQAQAINENKLNSLPGKASRFRASLNGDFPELSYPTDVELTLKTGAQVMFLRNDGSRERLYFNGKIGRVTDIDEGAVYVQCDGEEESIAVERVQWENIKYSLDEETKEIRESVVGTFTQYPLKLAWAITIHKSQGLTFDRAILDINAAFASGQVYVGLSRCRSLEGLVLKSPINLRNIINDPAIAGFSEEAQSRAIQPAMLEKLKRDYQQYLISELFDFTALRRTLASFIRMAGENASALAGDVRGKLLIMQEDLQKSIFEIAERFSVQLQPHLQTSLIPEANDDLQERIRKACVYFPEKLVPARDSLLNSLAIDTDNRLVEKNMEEAKEKMVQELHSKITCLQACKDGFFVKAYLKARAEATIEIPQKKQAMKKSAEVPAMVLHPALFNALKAWRTAKSLEMDVSAYMILHQKALLSIVTNLPLTTEALLAIKGIGLRKVKQFGEEIIHMVTKYCQENSIEPPLVEAPSVKKKKKEKPDTRQVSFDLYRRGLTVGEISHERSLSESTIAGHLAHFVRMGDIGAEAFVEHGKLNRIRDYLAKSGTRSLGIARAELGDEFSYTEIRFVMSELEGKERQN